VLADDVANAIADLLGLTLPALATPDEPPTRAIRFEPHDRSATTLIWQSGQWRTTHHDPLAKCVVRGAADAIALFVTGRITIADDRLTVDDPTDALPHFKSVFPGP
jgi:hypothetical protein